MTPGVPWSPRLQEALNVVAPGVFFFVTGTTVTLQFAGHTTDQQAAAQAVVDEFDFTDDAQLAWEVEKLRERAIALLNAATPEMAAQRALADMVLEAIQAIMTGLGMPTRPRSQLYADWANRLASGRFDHGMPE